MTLAVRPAAAGDAAFLAEVLVQAAYWRPEGPRGSVEEVLARPDFAHYVVGWPRPGDLGVVAEAPQAVGAAWLRTFGAADPGYGFVAAGTPELTIGVLSGERGRGVGTALLRALVETAREAGLPAVSLSVEPDNPALRLYERVGFRDTGLGVGALTLLLQL